MGVRGEVRWLAHNHTERFRELAAAVAALKAPTLTLDGEAVPKRRPFVYRVMEAGVIAARRRRGLAILGLPNRRLGMSHYDAVRGTAGERADTATEDLSNLYGRVPANDLPATFGALRAAQLDTRGAAHSSLAPDVAVQLGVPIEWRAMTPEQFNAVMTWIGEDRARLSSITGSACEKPILPAHPSTKWNTTTHARRSVST